MVDSDKGITNLHVPSDVIVDASMPAMIRTSGHMWGPDGQEADTLAVLPDSSYAGVYQVVIDDCRAQRRLRPVHHGLGAERRPDGAEGRGVRQPRQDLRDPRHRHGARRRRRRQRRPGAGGRAPATSSAPARPRTLPIRDWVKLAVTRARATGDPAVFWLDETRAHDAKLIAKVKAYLPEHDTEGLDIEIMSPGRGDRVLPGAHPPRREHHLGHRQRAARLPDRPVPDPGARHQRQDAVGRPADERRRPVRDRRRRLRARSTSSSWSRRTTCAGTAWASSSRWRVSFEHLATDHRQRARPGPRRHPRPRDRRPSSTRTSRRAAASAASTTAAATSTWPCTGPRSWPQQTDDAELAEAFAPLAKTLAEQEQTIVDELLAVQGSPGRHRRLLPARPGQGRGGHAPVRDLQRGARDPRLT